MKSKARSAFRKSRRNHWQSQELQRSGRARKLLFEPLEDRRLLTYIPGEFPALDAVFEGNFLPARETNVATEGTFLTAPAAGSKTTIGLNYLSNNAASFGLTASDFQHAIVTNNYTSGGITHIYLQQTFNDIPIADANASVHIAANGQVISADANFVKSLPHPAVPQPVFPDVPAQGALIYYANAVEVTMLQAITTESEAPGPQRKTVLNAPDLSAKPIKAELQYALGSDGNIHLGWRLNIDPLNQMHHWDILIGATVGPMQGRVIQLDDWMWNASYEVFERPVQDPLFATPFGTRTIAVNPHDALGGSPFGWHDANGVVGPEFLDTRGNNISAQDDLDDDDTGGTRATSPTLDFSSPLDFALPPIGYLNASITNAFYWANLAHDVTYAHGFDEVSGNFQHFNYTGQGLGNDRVETDIQEGGLIGNAYFVPSPDGQEGRMAFGIFPVAGQPARDSALDATIVVHEYGHGVSTRLTGGPANANSLDALQSGGMGEGWSDWLALVMTAQPSDTRDTPRTVGDWVTNAPGVGIRRQPYSFDKSIDTLTLADYNGDILPQDNASEVHNSGEIWATVLWDMTWLLIEKYGFNNDLYDDTGGLQVALDLVLTGMKLQPANPTFTQARDAIFAADLALYGGENTDELWEAFSRRGFGYSAQAEFAPNLGPNSLVVVEAFDRPTPLARISGTVFQDLNGNNRRDAIDAPLQGWTVYVDANNNAQFDVGEKSDVSGIDGSYSLSFFSSAGSARVRQVRQTGYTQVLPASNGGYSVQIPGRGQVVTGIDFGNKELPGQVSGIKWHDLNADGIYDLDDPLTVGINEGEPGLQGVVIYADLNNDGRIGVLEPAAITDINGRYTINNIQPGTYTIRELYAGGYTQTFPDPADPAVLGAHVGVVVDRGVITPDINFGNVAAIDFGDAPTAAQSGFAASYPTTLAQNGARHGILPGFGLGAAIDAEADGQPTQGAVGDDTAGAADDEEGVVMPPLTPGFPATLTVTVRNGGFSAGLLQGWIDWNRDGDWNDAGEKIVSNRLLRESLNPHFVTFDVPAGTTLGPIYARFRYGYESSLGPTGPSAAGEVEDYVAVVLDENPVALPDCFGGGGTIASDPGNGAPCVPIIVKQGNAGTTLDVLANDFGTINGGPFLIGSDFPIFTAGGGVVNFNAGTLVYTPHPTFIGRDEFFYRIQDGDVPPNVSSPVANTSVAIHVTAADPKAVDDTRTLNAALTTLRRLDDEFIAGTSPDLLDNDLSPDPANTRIVAGTLTRLTPGPAPAGEVAQITTDGQSLEFRQGTGFKGTVIYQYQIDDTDPLTAPATARVTIQVVDGLSTPAPSHWAQLEVQYLDLAGNPIVGIAVGQDFIVRVVATDIGPANLDTDPANPPAFVDRTLRGVEAAFLDLLYDQTLATPVSSNDNPLDFMVTFDGKLGTEATGGTQVVTSTVQGTPTPIAISGTGLDPSPDIYNGLVVVFTSGPLTGQRARVSDYTGASQTLIFEAGSFTGAPVAGNSFRIESSLYNQNQSGTINTPAPGAIDEMGGVHADPNPPIFFTGAGANTVFSARFRANASGQFRAIGDPADRLLTDGINPPLDTRVFLVNSPNPQPNELVPLTDERVYLKSPGPLSIAAPGAEGEFSNFRNPLDVNDDSYVSPVDALSVINSLTSGGGSRPLSQYAVGASGWMPVGYVDVNGDGFVAPIDALIVINYLNAGTLPAGLAGGEGEGGPLADEGEGESPDVYGPAGAEAALALTLSEDLPEGEVSEEDLCDLPLPLAVKAIFSDLADDITDWALALADGYGDHEDVLDLVVGAVEDLQDRLDCEDLFDLHPWSYYS